MNAEYPAPVYRLLELAEKESRVADVPPDLAHARRFAESKRLVEVTPAHCVGWTRAKTRRKKARELRKGEWIQFEPNDKNGYWIESVVVGPRTVHVSGSGGPVEYAPDAVVTVYDGPLPREVYSDPKLHLLPDGVAALAMRRLSDGATNVTAAAPADWNNFRDERRPDGELLTVKVCKRRYKVSGKDLSLAAGQDPAIRKKNPAGGSAYVYRWDAVRDLSDRKSRDE